MSLFKTIERVRQIDSLIRRKATGNPGEFARKLGISRSMLMLNIQEFRDMGIKIEYDQNINSYKYIDNSIIIKFEIVSHEANPDTKPDGVL